MAGTVSEAETRAPKEPGAPGGTVSSAEAAHGPRPCGQDMPGVGEPSGRPQRLRGLAPGPSLLAANLNCPGFLISKAGINRHPPPLRLPPEGCREDRGAALCHSTCCATASVHTYGVAAVLGAVDGQSSDSRERSSHPKTVTQT